MEHVEYIGMFARCLVELGKEYELKFYLTELEKLHTSIELPEFGFQIGVIYSTGSFTNFSLAKQYFQKVITKSTDKDLRIKATMFLAKIYDSQGDVAACRKLVDTIESARDANLQSLVYIWKAKVLKDEGKFEPAHKLLDKVLNSVTIENDWYSYFCCQIILASLYLKEKKKDLAIETAQKLRKDFHGKAFKTVKDQMDDLEKRISDENSLGIMEVDDTEDVISVCYNKKKIQLEKRTSIGRLVRLFMKNDTLSKNTIIKAIYDREYVGEPDNKLIYYHIHTFRKEMEKVGLPNDAIEKTVEGYRLNPGLKLQNGEIT